MRQHSKQTTRLRETDAMESALKDLFLDQLGDVYDAEQQLIKALPRMADLAESDLLREAFLSHLDVTREHVKRLEEAAKSLGLSLPKRTCAAMKGLIQEGEQMIKEQKHKASLDAALIAAAQTVEHYQIAKYGTLRTWAHELGRHSHAMELLARTLGEEGLADEKLTGIAESWANQRALQA
jgi:ferritin-like metal-binding protein YciE